MTLIKVALGVAMVGLGGVAHATPITTLFNTGVDASGAPLPNASTAETHYTLATSPVGSSAVLAAHTAVGGFPVPPWTGDDSLSAWIGPNNDAALDGPVGTYDYRTTFSLAGFSATSASIMGDWSADNAGIDILVNSLPTGQATDSPGAAYSSATSFAITSGFVPGTNTLDFIVRNDGGPTGLRVEMTGNAAPIQEPVTLALLATGLTGLGLLRRRRL